MTQIPRIRICPICDSPIENVEFPHMHIEPNTGRIINSQEAWEEVHGIIQERE